MKKITLIGCLIAACSFAFSQSWEDQVLDSRTLILDGIELRKEKKFDAALEKFDLILESDTNYLLSLIEKSSTLVIGEENDEAIEVCKEAFKMDSFELRLYINLGNAYKELGETEKSIAVFDEGLKKFPMNYLLQFNKGLTYERVEEFDKAVEEYKKTLALNPFHNSSHIRLAIISQKEGKLTQATLSMLTYLVLNPETDGGLEVLEVLNTYLSEKPVYDPVGVVFSKKGDDFSEIDELLKAQVALNKKYQFESDVDFALIRQSHALLSLLKDYEPDGGFYDEFYVPFFQELMETKNFSGFSYFIASSSTNESVRKTIFKHDKELKTFADWFYDEGVLHFRNTDVERIFYSYPYNLNGYGPVVDDLYEGTWTYFNKEGSLMSTGDFKADKRVGHWEWYYLDGQVEYEYNFVDDEKDGVFKAYHPNGNLREQGNYDMGKLDGELLQYYINGGIENRFNYVDGELQGKQYIYHENGNKYLEVDFKDGIQDGMYKSYFPNGELFYEYEVKDGEKIGSYQSYFYNGEKSYSGIYADNELNGDFESYYINGNLYYKGKAIKGSTVGEYIENYFNGKKYQEYSYDENGKMNGIKKEYDIDGKLYFESTYEKGEQKRFVYFDKNGKVIEDQVLKNNQTFRIYYPTGELRGEGKNYKGDKDGLWTFYYKDGSIESKGEYDKGNRVGEFEWYHKNGQLSEISSYEDNIQSHYVKYYFSNGTLRKEGRIEKDERVGPWKYYNEFGQIVSEEFFVDGEINGIDFTYDIEGKLESKYYYELGVLKKIELFDVEGNKYFETELDKLKAEEVKNVPLRFTDKGGITRTYKNGVLDGPYTITYPNGVKKLEAALLGDEYHGTWNWKYVNGKPDVEKTYVFGQVQGLVKNYTIYGFKVSESNYLDDELNGKKTRFYPDGKIFYTQEFADDMQNGPMDYYDKTGNKNFTVYFLNNSPIYYVSNYFNTKPDTTIVEKGTVDIDAKFANGKSAVQVHFKNDLEIGDFKVFGEDGTPIYHSTLKDDDLNGKRIYYYPGTGKEMIVEEFEHGYRNGEAVQYSKEGKVLLKANYKAGRLHGDYVEYDNNGKITFQAKFYDGDVVSVQ